MVIGCRRTVLYLLSCTSRGTFSRHMRSEGVCSCISASAWIVSGGCCHRRSRAGGRVLFAPPPSLGIADGVPFGDGNLARVVEVITTSALDHAVARDHWLRSNFLAGNLLQFRNTIPGSCCSASLFGGGHVDRDRRP